MPASCSIDARRYRAILFDMDGVVTDTMGFHYEAFRRAFGELGIALKPLDVYTREGMPSAAIARGLLEAHGAEAGEEDVARAVEKKRRFYRQIAPGNIRAYPGVRETLALLRQQGVRLALVTGSNRASAMDAIGEAGLAGMFDAVVAAGDTERGKPFPDPYLQGLERLGADKAHSVAVENAPMGIRSAKAAGIGYVIAVTTTLPAGYLREADDVMPSFGDLGDCLARRLGAEAGREAGTK